MANKTCQHDFPTITIIHAMIFPNKEFGENSTAILQKSKIFCQKLQFLCIFFYTFLVLLLYSVHKSWFFKKIQRLMTSIEWYGVFPQSFQC